MKTKRIKTRILLFAALMLIMSLMLGVSAGAMQIYVKPAGSAHITVDGVEGSDKVERVKEIIQEKSGIPAALQQLTFNDIPLVDDDALSDYAIQNGNDLKLTLLPAGYIDENGAAASCAEYTLLTDSMTDLSAGWYVVGSNLSINTRIHISGDVHIILMDGATLNAQKGIGVPKGSHLHIYGQSDPTGQSSQIGRTGCLNAGENIEGRMCGIGADGEQSTATYAGDITINGGIITAKGGVYSSAIGGACDGYGGTVTINGGSVTATAGTYATAIGSGYNGWCGNIIINGGSVTATGESITDGTIGANLQEYAPEGGSNGKITINGGYVEARRLGDLDKQMTVEINGGIAIAEYAPNLVKTCGIYIDKDSIASNGEQFGNFTLFCDLLVGDDTNLYVLGTLTVPSDIYLTVNGNLFVAGTLNGSATGNIHYPLTVTDGGFNSPSGNVGGTPFAKVGATIDLFADDGIAADSWLINGVESAGSSFVMPAKATTASPVHSWGNWASKDDSTHTRGCTIEGCTKTEEGTHTLSGGVCSACGYKCPHSSLSHTAAKAATAQSEGNTEYWRCNRCGLCFSDKSGANVISEASTVLAKLNVAATDDGSMLTLWAAVAIACCGALALVRGKRRGR